MQKDRQTVKLSISLPAQSYKMLLDLCDHLNLGKSALISLALTRLHIGEVPKRKIGEEDMTE